MQQEELKYNISQFNQCYGCGVCAVDCPKQIISMQLDADGFFRPFVDEKACVKCGKCLKICAFYSSSIQKKNNPTSYACYSINEKIRNQCSSGGVGFELAKYALSQGYIFCGVRYNVKQNRAEHYIARTINELYDSCGSKYIQSYSIEAFSQFSKNEKYMVVGTPCQIDSLRKSIRMKKMEGNFILIDFFCHGVPSYLMWKKYLKEFGMNDTLEVKWRDKRTGWHDSWNMIFKRLHEETFSLMSKGDLFYKFFLKNRCLNKVCYDDCKYKMTSSAADIRIGDLWGTKYQNDEKGVSGVLTFTQKGKEFLQQLDTCTIISESLEVVTESQMKKCAAKPSSYNYIRKALQSDLSLKFIDKKADRIEFFLDVIPHDIKYYMKRFFEKVLCK